MKSYTLRDVFESVEIAPPGVLSVMPGDKVRVTATLEYKGSALVDTFRACIGKRHPITGFAEYWTKQVSFSWAASADWVPKTLTADIQIPTDVGSDLLDIYVKIEGHLDAGLPEYDGVIQVMGGAFFQNFAITDYSKV